MFLSGPSTDESWTSVVGEGPPPPATVAATTPPAQKPAVSAPAKTPVAAKKIAPAPAQRVEKRAAPQAKPAVATASPAAAAPASNAHRAEARAIYAGRCVPCHGANGRGDGPAGAALNPHPRNFTDRGWQSSVSTAHIAKVIANGGPSVGKSPLMPAQSDLASNPALLRALAEYIQDFGK